MNRFAVIMAGGGGTRFWPLSRQSMPKQLINLSGNDVMINETIIRNCSIIPEGNVYIVTTKNQESTLKKVLSKKIINGNILLEPVARNTAACIGYAAKVIHKRHGDGIICVFPSDHCIGDSGSYVKTLEMACELAEKEDKIITIGIKPTYPATGYGYIKHAHREISKNVYTVDRFIEKPDLEKAKRYLQEGGYLWNSGIFIWKTSIILENFKRFLPKLYKQLEELGHYIDSETHGHILEEIYPELQSISV
ncbi:MAG: mannose-1-phosphate guanylyltransferase, partial [Actinobacteria bacterium]|nr:mannose-1-phosphate guanylyltransferase [Actinomycetota bacterium]